MAFHYSPKIVTDGLVFYVDAANPKSFVNGNTTWNDLSRSGNNGVLTNGPTFDSGNGGSIVFDGLNDYVEFLTNNNLNSSTDITLSVWVRWTSNLATFMFPISKQVTTGSTIRQYAFYLRNQTNNKTLTLTTDNGSGGNTQSNSTISIPFNTWALMTVSIKSGQVNSSKFYVNDTPETISNTHTIYGDSNATLFLGRRGEDNNYHWNGNIGPVFIYNRVLTDSEVKQNYNALKTRFGL